MCIAIRTKQSIVMAVVTVSVRAAYVQGCVISTNVPHVPEEY